MALTSREKELLRQPVDEGQVNLDVVIDNASRKNPDRHAKVMGVARDTNMPVAIVETEMDEIQRRERVKAIDPSQYGPHLRKLLEDSDRAAVTLDDLDNLAATEKALERGSLGWQMDKAGRYLKLLGGSLAAGVSDIGGGLFDILGAGTDIAASVTTRPLANLAVIDQDVLGDAAAMNRYRASRARQAGSDLLVPDELGFVEGAVSSGLRSVPTSLYGLLIGAATGNPNIGLGFMSGAAGARAFSEAREQGVDVLPSTVHGVEHGIVEFATERMPMMKMFEDFGVDASLLKKLGGQMATEIPGEQIATAFQDLADWANLPENEDKSFNSYLTERPDAALQTLISTAVATSVQTTTVHAVDRLVNGKPSDTAELKQAQRLLESQNDQERLDGLIELAQASKTNQRAQDIYREFLKGAGSDQNIYIPEDVAMALENPHAVIVDQIDLTGTDIEIPMDVFMSELVNDPQLMESLRPHMKMGVDTMSATEIEQGGDAETLSALDRAKNAVDVQSELDEITENVYRQLKSTGRQTEQEARANARLTAAAINKKVKDYGLTPSEVMSRMNMTITGPQGGVVTEETEFTTPPVTKSDLERLSDQPQADRRVVDRSESDRRKDDNRRKRVDEMSPEERVRVIYKNELTGLNNRRAFDEDLENSELVVSIDVDNLKAVNDNLGQNAGDNMLKTVASVMDSVAGNDAYHISGDEFYLLGNSESHLNEVLAAIDKTLSESSIQSDKGFLKGLGISYGIATSKNAADSAMKKAKIAREKSGERVARGEKPTGMTMRDIQSLEQTISPTQEFGDLELIEQVEVEGTGQTVTISQSAQRAFDQTMKRRDVVEKVRDCLSA